MCSIPSRTSEWLLECCLYLITRHLFIGHGSNETTDLVSTRNLSVSKRLIIFKFKHLEVSAITPKQKRLLTENLIK